ncbi:hypothetical protein ATSB10_36190 [Dyella thiooxydans]|uniref:Uncharacterized protein n=2 Tax=Dyella thiooxydans TaxID=445710 RepID=A0A160N4T3_9GAMM|nr:hypothetical protein ATSB10_36190 [Dyella thiooxydans]
MHPAGVDSSRQGHHGFPDVLAIAAGVKATRGRIDAHAALYGYLSVDAVAGTVLPSAVRGNCRRWLTFARGQGACFCITPCRSALEDMEEPALLSMASGNSLQRILGKVRILLQPEAADP